MLRLLVLFLLFGGWSTSSMGQDSGPYQLRSGKDIAITAGSGALFGLGHWMTLQVDPAQESEILLLNRNDIRGFDRSATSNYDLKMAQWSDVALFGVLALPATTLFFPGARKQLPTLAVIYLETGLLVNGIKLISKAGFKRFRPYAYNVDLPLEVRQEKDGRFSFVSGHAANAAAFSFASASILHNYLGERSKPLLIYSTASALTAGIGYMRYKAGKHFFTDLMAGAAIGTGVGLLVPALHSRNGKLNGRLELLVLPNYTRLSYRL